MNNLTTAEEFFKKCINNHGGVYSSDLIEFAKLHAQAALKAASENVKADFEPIGWLAEQHSYSPFIEGQDYEIGISRQSILQSYPLENIK